MLELFETSRFKRDRKRLKKQGRDLNKLKVVIRKLCKQQKLEKKYHDHSLTGPWKGYRDCHIEPDWLLIYKTDKTTLYLVRSGSHSELFK